MTDTALKTAENGELLPYAERVAQIKLILRSVKELDQNFENSVRADGDPNARTVKARAENTKQSKRRGRWWERLYNEARRPIDSENSTPVGNDTLYNTS